MCVSKCKDAESLPDAFGASFLDQAVRMKFIRKVYTIIFLQLLATTMIVALTILTGARNIMCTRIREGRCENRNNFRANQITNG